MTKRQKRDLTKIGNVIYNHRRRLSLEKGSRKFFLDDRVKKGLLAEGDISEKTLANIENGYTLPSLVTLNYLSTALEIDLLKLVEEVREYIPRR